MGLLLISLPLIVSIFVFWRVLVHVQHVSKARSLGCLPAPLYRPWDLFGVHNLRMELNGMQTHRLSHSFVLRRKWMSEKLGRDCTTFRIRYPPGETWFYTYHPKNMQAVLATQFGDFQQPAARVGAFEPLLGLGIFSANGPKWEHSRAILKPQFHREQVADLGLFETHVQALFNTLTEQPLSEGWTATFNLQPFLERYTTDVATEFLFGESVHSQRDDGKDDDNHSSSALVTATEMKAFVEAFFAAQRTTAKAIILGDLYWLAHDRRFKENCKIVHSFVDTYVQRRLKDGTSGMRVAETGANKEKYVVLDALVADVKDAEDLRSQLLNILLAGSDTISGTLGFLVASLAQYPDIFNRLRETILQDFGTFRDSKPITVSALKNCTYLQWCINEVLRVYPSVPVNAREAVRDTTLPLGGGVDGRSPVFIPKGYLVAWEVWTMHSNPKYWGADADQFNPDRWKGRKFGFDYLPFNAGPRICIGQQFALAEIAYVTVRLLQNFDAIDGANLPLGRLPCEWKLVDKVAGGVNVRLHVA